MGYWHGCLLSILQWYNIKIQMETKDAYKNSGVKTISGKYVHDPAGLPITKPMPCCTCLVLNRWPPALVASMLPQSHSTSPPLEGELILPKIALWVYKIIKSKFTHFFNEVVKGCSQKLLNQQIQGYQLQSSCEIRSARDSLHHERIARNFTLSQL